MKKPIYRIFRVMNSIHLGGHGFNTVNNIEYASKKEAEDYIKENTSSEQRVILEILPNNTSYLVYLEDKK